MKVSLRYKYAWIIFSLVLALGGIAGGTVYFQTRDTLEELVRSSSQALGTQLMGQLEKRARVFALFLAQDFADPLYYLDLQTLGNKMKSARQHADVVSLFVFDAQGRIVHDGTGANEQVDLWMDDPLSRNVLNTGMMVMQAMGEGFFIAVPIKLGDDLLGGILVEYSLKPIRATIEAGQAELARRAKENFHRHLVMFGFMVTLLALFAAGITLVIARGFSQPIERLARAAHAIGRGRYDVSVPLLKQDELGELARAFQKMAQDLRGTTVSKTYLDTIVSSMMSSLIVTDSEGRIKLANRSALDLLGYEESGLLGESVDRVFARQDLFRRSLVQRLGGGDAVKPFEEYFSTRDGCNIPVLVSGAVVRDEGQQVREYIFVAHDIGERKRTEDELNNYRNRLEDLVEKRTTELQLAHEQLRHSEKLSALGKLVGSVAHEFNNPIYGIRNVLEQIGDEANLDEELKGLLQLAVKETHRMADLIQKLQGFYRPSSEQIRPLNIHEVIDDMVLLSRKRLIDRGIELRRCYGENMPEVCAVPDQIKQVILNLIHNAEEAMGDRGGQIQIRTEVAGSNVQIHIDDTGPGIHPEHMDHLFEPFFTTKGAVKGTGLGLSISYGIIKQHGGDILVNTRSGQGAVFTLVLPILQATKA